MYDKETNKMKIMFLHLSDIHCEDNNSMNNLKQDKRRDCFLYDISSTGPRR